MVETRQDATVYRKQAETVRFTIPEDVTGWTFEYSVRALDNSGAALFTRVNANMTIDADTTSTVDVSLTASNLDIEETTYAHALWRTDSGFEKPLAVGELSVLPSSHTL